MLIEFKVTNYRSLCETQTLSMVTTKDTALQATNCIRNNIAAIPFLVRAAVLYGPNASGKSNLILALAFLRSMVETSAVGIREGQTLNIAPFRFNQETMNRPSEFEVTFIENGMRYQYGLAVTSTRVIREWLHVVVERKPQRWFEREYDEKTDKEHWYLGSHLNGGKQRQLWRDSTRANSLFLSTAVNLNSEQLRPVFNWFVNQLVVIGSNQQPLPIYTMQRIKNEEAKSKIISLLQAADLGITDVQIKETKAQQVEFRVEQGKAAIETGSETEISIATLYHQGHNEPVGFDLSEESHGTQKLFAYAAPVLDVIRDNKILVIDEFDSSLHPQMVQFLIKLIQNNEADGSKAQLIFSTHNTSLLDANLFRRDQIWFIEKDHNQESHLYPLTDFSPRKNEALERGYLIGRYGALPFFGDFKF